MAPDHQIRRQRRRNRLSEKQSRKVGRTFGGMVDMSAYPLTSVVFLEGRERKSLDILERKGAVAPSEPYICGVCGLKCKTNLDL